MKEKIHTFRFDEELLILADKVLCGRSSVSLPLHLFRWLVPEVTRHRIRLTDSNHQLIYKTYQVHFLPFSPLFSPSSPLHLLSSPLSSSPRSFCLLFMYLISGSRTPPSRAWRGTTCWPCTAWTCRVSSWSSTAEPSPARWTSQIWQALLPAFGCKSVVRDVSVTDTWCEVRWGEVSGETYDCVNIFNDTFKSKLAIKSSLNLE